MKRYIAFLALALTVKAQQGPPPTVTLILPVNANRYFVQVNTTKLTIQLGANSGITLVPERVYISCASDSTVTFSWNGTAATTTSTPISKWPGISKAAVATAWTNSNAGAGTTGPSYPVTAGSLFPLDWTMTNLFPSGPVQNLTIATTNACDITAHFREESGN